jgi:hypothetical protein
MPYILVEDQLSPNCTPRTTPYEFRLNAQIVVVGPAIYCSKQNTVSTHAFNLQLFTFIMLRSAWPFIISVTPLTYLILYNFYKNHSDGSSHLFCGKRIQF